jgi:hypothetical protein
LIPERIGEPTAPRLRGEATAAWETDVRADEYRQMCEDIAAVDYLGSTRW